MRTGRHGFSRLTRWGRSGVSFLTWSRLKSHNGEKEIEESLMDAPK